VTPKPTAIRVIDGITEQGDYAAPPGGLVPGHVLTVIAGGKFQPRPPGPGSSALTLPNLVNADIGTVFAGQAVTTAPSPGGMKRATATVNKPAIGLAKTNAAIGFTGDVQTFGDFTQNDWTAVIGTAQLTQGAKYFLSSLPGMLSEVPPTIPGQLMQHIGTAISPTTLTLVLSNPILL